MNDFGPGKLFIVAAPSGGGKTSLVKHLTSHLADIEVSISHTTREKRPREQHGIDYFFVDDETFKQMVANDQFVEHAQVFNHFYGTSIEQIKARLAMGIDIVLDIDWQGAQQIKASFTNAVGIFIIPPSLAALEERLRQRKQDSTMVIEKRMQQAKDELSHYQEFDYIIVNDHFDKAALELQAIVMASRLECARQQKRHHNLLSKLLT